MPQPSENRESGNSVLRYLVCKGEGCHRPIPIPYSNLLETPSSLQRLPMDAGHEIVACPACGLVSDYTPLDTRLPHELQGTVPYPETLRHVGILEFECATNNCATRVSVLLPTDAAANADTIWRAAQRWRFVDAHCKKNRDSIVALPKREKCWIAFAAEKR